MDNDDISLEKWSEEKEVDYQLASELKAKIFPLLEEAHRKLGYRFNKAFIEQIKGTKLRIDNSERILSLLPKLKPQFFSPKERRVITFHLEYLTLVEGLFASQINFLIFVLIAKGHALHFTRKGDNVKTLADIERMPLRRRLGFLRKHMFGKLIANKVDVRLRNSVAHLFYEIDEKGTIKVENKTITQTEYDKLYDDLRNVSYALHLITLLYYKRFA